MSDLLAKISSMSDGLPNQGVFATLGLVAIVILGAIALFWLVRLALILAHRVHIKAAMRAMERDTTPGSKVMVASLKGTQGMSARAVVLDALENYLPEFNFGSAFYLGACPISIEATDFALSKTDHETLKAAFETSDANIIIWGETRGSEKGAVLCMATPGMLDGLNPRGFFAFTLKGAPSEWNEDARRAIAYVVGRRLRPALGRPADFRADRLVPIADSMSRLLAAEAVLSGQALTELEDDYAASALHIGQNMKSMDWLTRAADYRTRALAGLKRSDDPVRWAQAKLDLGRALTSQCELKFDQAKLQEAMAHVREAIESTKTDSRMQIAELGIAALKQAETMLANRRRFSIRWNV